MGGRVLEVLLFALIPVAATVVGGVVAAFWALGPRVRSAIQHFAAGVVFAAVAGELLPELLKQHQPVVVVVGFAAGTALMLLVRALARRLEPKAPGQVKQPTGLLATVGVDILIDGLLVGVGFAAGTKQGVLITIALTIEVLFLGLAAAVSLRQAGWRRGKVVATTAGLALLLAVGAAAGTALLTQLPAQAAEGVVAFGAAALLYLVTEELLVEAHEVPETPWTTAVFFAGFLLLFVIEMIL